MYKRFTLLFILILTLAIAPTAALAQAGNTNPSPLIGENALDSGGNILRTVGGQAGFNQNAQATDLPRVIGLVINGFLALLGVLFMAYVVYGGYLWLSAGGNDEQIGKAKKIIRAAIVGMIVVLAAYLITRFVLDLVSTAGIYDTQPSSQEIQFGHDGPAEFELN